jgi:hypothetical protein
MILGLGSPTSLVRNKHINLLTWVPWNPTNDCMFRTTHKTVGAPMATKGF